MVPQWGTQLEALNPLSRLEKIIIFWIVLYSCLARNVKVFQHGSSIDVLVLFLQSNSNGGHEEVRVQLQK